MRITTETITQAAPLPQAWVRATDPFAKCAKAGIAGALLSVVTLVANAQEFPPFPEPAVGPFPDTENIALLSQILPNEMAHSTPAQGCC